MRAFIFSLVAFVGLAVGAWFVLEGFFARDADQVYILPSARIGEDGTVESRDFSGRRADEPLVEDQRAAAE